MSEQQVSELRAALALTEQRLRQFEEKGRPVQAPDSVALTAISPPEVPLRATQLQEAVRDSEQQQLPLLQSQVQPASPPTSQQLPMQGALVPQQIAIAPSPGVALQVQYGRMRCLETHSLTLLS